MAITMSKELLIRVPEGLYRRIKEVSAHEYKSMSAFIRDIIKEREKCRLEIYIVKIAARGNVYKG